MEFMPLLKAKRINLWTALKPVCELQAMLL